MTLREFDLFIEGRRRREEADYRQLATHAYWVGLEYAGKKLKKPDELLGKKSKGAQRLDDYGDRDSVGGGGGMGDPTAMIARLNKKSATDEVEHDIDLEGMVTVDLVGEADVDAWYWIDDDDPELE